MNVAWIAQDPAKVRQADKAALQSERVFPLHGLIKSLTGGPEEKHDRQDDLRCQQKVGKDFIGEDDILHEETPLSEEVIIRAHERG
jgi:hypothetical protein